MVVLVIRERTPFHGDQFGPEKRGDTGSIRRFGVRTEYQMPGMRRWPPGAGGEAMPMKFVTRQNVRIDRVSSSWLIWTFIDPEAEILFVPTEEVIATAEHEDAIPFDVPGVAMSHHGNECS